MTRSYMDNVRNADAYRSRINVGDKAIHVVHGTGIVTWISPNPSTVLAIKVHFKEAQRYGRFTSTGKEYLEQSIPVVTFIYSS